MSAFCKLHGLSFNYIHRELITRALIECPKLAEKWGVPESIPDWHEIISQPLPSLTSRWAYQRVRVKSSHNEIDPLFAAPARRDILLERKEKIRIPVIIENWANNIQELTVEVIGRNHWRMLEVSSRTIAVPARSAIDQQYMFELTAPQSVQLPEIHVETCDIGSDGSRFRITINAGALHAQPFFEPRFIGKAALHNRGLLRAFLEQQSDKPLPDERLGEWLLIEGSAGVGKSRIIEEALLKPIGGIADQHTTKVRRYFVQHGGDRKVILEVLSDMMHMSKLPHKDAVDHAIKLLKTEGLTTTAIEAAASIFRKALRDPLLIVLEDLHHGGDKFYSWLQTVFEGTTIPSPSGSALRFCVTGRNDDTFPNPRQAAFTETLRRNVQERGLATPRIINVLPLDEDDARTLVDGVFQGLTEAACDRILKLSANVPFNILQVIEYLCEQSLVEINDSRTYSIRNDVRFYNKLGIPRSMGMLLELRLSHLKKQQSGDGLVSILRCLALLGLQCSRNIYHKLVQALAPEGDPWLLFNANYLVLDECDQVRFSHENILNFLQPGQGSAKAWTKAARTLARDADILAGLEEWRRCRIFEIAGQTRQVAEIVTRVVGDGSVAGLARDVALGEVYQILRMGVDLWQRRGKDQDSALFLLNLYFLWAYASKFTRHYGATINDALAALEAVRSRPSLERLVGERRFNLACAKIEQIIGHAYQNVGNTDLSMTHVLNALTEARRWDVEGASHLDLLFDAEDRLRKNCIIIGRLAQARRAFQAACTVAERKGDEVLLGTGQYGEAELYFVQDPDRAEAVWQRLASRATTHTDLRVQITLELALVQTRLLKAEDQATIDGCLDELKELGDRSLRLGLVGPLPKVNLLSGYAQYRLGNFNRATEDFLACYDKAEQSGYGVFLWFSQNNIAMVLQHLDRDEQVLRAFETALNKAEMLGFLKHLEVSKPLFFQAALVDNAWRYYDRKGLSLHLRRLEERLARNGCRLEKLPRQGLAHERFQTHFGTMMLFV